jgi:hypothetical protein
MTRDAVVAAAEDRPELDSGLGCLPRGQDCFMLFVEWRRLPEIISSDDTLNLRNRNRVFYG